MNKEQAEPGPRRDEESKSNRDNHSMARSLSHKSIISKGHYIVEGEIKTVLLILCFQSVHVVLGEYIRLSLFCPCYHSYCGYLLKKEVNWMKSQHVFSLFGN